MELLGIKERHVTTGAVCVYPSRVADCVKALGPGSKVNIASVATGFPAGQTPLDTRLAVTTYFSYPPPRICRNF